MVKLNRAKCNYCNEPGCHACYVREQRHQQKGGKDGCPLCREREALRRHVEYSKFPVAMTTMYGLMAADKNLSGRRTLPHKPAA